MTAPPLTPSGQATKRRRLAMAAGTYVGYVPAAPVRAHVCALLDAGVSRGAVAAAAGVSWGTVAKLVDGAHASMQPAVAARLERVTLETVRSRPDPTGYVLAVGARRRIRALLANGWRHVDITARMHQHRPGCTRSQLVLHKPGEWVTRRTHDAVAAAYDALADHLGPSQYTRDRAAAAGYVPPIAWDDDTIDDPAALPQHDAKADTTGIDHVAVERAMAGDRVPLTRAERWVAVERLAGQGLSDRAIATRLHVTDRTVLRDRQALGLPTRWDPTALPDPTRTHWRAAS